MSGYDDIQRGLQEFIVPDLSDIKTRLGALEVGMNGVEHAVRDSEQRSEERDREIARASQERDKELLRTVERGFDHMDNSINNLARQIRTEEELRSVLQRLAALEAKSKERAEATQ